MVHFMLLVAIRAKAAWPSRSAVKETSPSLTSSGLPHVPLTYPPHCIMKTIYIGWIVADTRYASMPRPARKCFVKDSPAVTEHQNFMPRRFLLMEKLFPLAEMPVHLLLKPNLNSNSWHKTNLPETAVFSTLVQLWPMIACISVPIPIYIASANKRPSAGFTECSGSIRIFITSVAG